MNRSLAEVLQSLLTRVQNRDFGFGFIVDVITLALLVLLMVKPDDAPNVYGDDPQVGSLAADLYQELTGEPPVVEGPFSSAVVLMVAKILIGKALELLVESELPADLIELLRGWLEALRDRI